MAEFRACGFEQPSLQDGQVVGIDILKSDAEAKIWLRIEYCSLGFEIFAAGVKLEGSLHSLFQGIGQFHEAPMKTQFGDAGGNARLPLLLNDLGGGNERIPGSSATFVFQEDTPKSSCGIVPSIGIQGPKNAKKRRK
jgi:hypothetical protein